MSKQIIESFYEAFKNHQAEAMNALYHPNATFSDPVFRNLNHEEACAMWEMLISRAKGNLKIEFHSIVADDKLGQCTWEARYPFSKTQRQVHNVIHATMEFQEGLIVKHTDQFNLWRWSGMALGIPGKLLGWTPMIQNKIRRTAMNSLMSYMSDD